MTSATAAGQSGGSRQYVQSWAFSLLFHALAVGSAVVFLGDLNLIPEPEPFKWDVALVETSKPKSEEQPAPAQAKPKATQPAPTKSAQTAEVPVEPKPVPQPVQTVQTVQPVRQESPQPVPPAPIVSQPVHPPTSPVEAPQEKPKEELVRTATAYSAFSEPAPVQAYQEAPSVSHHSEPVAAAAPSVAPSAPASVAAALQHSAEEAPPASVHDQPAAKESTANNEMPLIQEASVREASARPASIGKADYGWLAKSLWERVAMLKRYPHVARANHLEGRVLLRVVIKDDGHIRDLQVAESSGHPVLDQDALEVVRRACPLKLAHPLGRSHVVVQIPINYRLEH